MDLVGQSVVIRLHEGVYDVFPLADTLIRAWHIDKSIFTKASSISILKLWKYALGIRCR
jgi:hypothetical protein